MNKIKISTHQHFLHEVQTWMRSLDFYKQENEFLKNRLSQVLDSNSDKLFLDFAEQFNTKFLFMDDYIQELNRDLRLQMNLLRENLMGNLTQQKSLQNLQNKLRIEMMDFEKKVTLLKYDFNREMAGYIDFS
jgi:hypothetical protein